MPATINLSAEQLRQVELERKLLFLAGARRMPVPAAVMALFLAWVVKDAIEPALAYSWAAAVLALFVARAIILRTRDGAPPSADAVPALGRIVGIIGAMIGILTGLGALLVFPYTGDDQEALITMVFTGWFAGGVGTNGPYPRWFIPWAVPHMGLLVLAWLMRNDAVGYSVAALLLLFCVMLGASVRDQSRSIIRALRTQFELANAVQQLQARERQLESALRAKSNFLAAASHDLRQPVVSIGLLVSALLQSNSFETMRRLALKLDKPIEAMESLLSSLLEISRLEAGVVSVRKSDFSLTSLVNQLADEFRGRLFGNTVAIRVDIPELHAFTDKNLVERALRNLLDNAVKFTVNGLIDISAVADGKDLTLKVRDTGIGIDGQLHERVFEDYFQVGNVQRSRDKGLGLGLSIVRRVIELLGGTVAIESTLGQGSTLIITLPDALAAPVAPVVTATQGNDLQRLQNRRIVLIEDDDLVRSALETVLNESGARTRAYGSYEPATAAMQEEPGWAEGVIVDYRLSDRMNGIEVLRTIRTKWPAVKSLLITGDTDPEVLKAASNSGFRVLHKTVLSVSALGSALFD